MAPEASAIQELSGRDFLALDSSCLHLPVPEGMQKLLQSSSQHQVPAQVAVLLQSETGKILEQAEKQVFSIQDVKPWGYILHENNCRNVS